MIKICEHGVQQSAHTFNVHTDAFFMCIYIFLIQIYNMARTSEVPSCLSNNRHVPSSHNHSSVSYHRDAFYI